VDLMSQLGRQPGGLLVGDEAATAAWDQDLGMEMEQSPTSHQAGWGAAFQNHQEEGEASTNAFDQPRMNSNRDVPKLQMNRLSSRKEVSSTPDASDPFGAPIGESTYAPFGSSIDSSPNPFGDPSSAAPFGDPSSDAPAAEADDDYRPFG